MTSSSISLYKPDLASLSTLTEADFDIPLIKVIEWIKRSWDSISPERIFLSWRRTHLINFTQTWPATDSNVIMKSFNILQPILKKASIYNTTKSYGKLVEVMGYLNVVIPWKVDELLGLVNESGKITLSYASIEEIIGSCLLESYDKVTETAAAAAASATAASAEGEAAESTVGTVAARTTTEVAASSSGIANTPSGLTLPNSINNRITAPRTNNGNSNGTLDWSDPQFDVNYLNNSNLPSVSNINNSAMNIKSLLAATSHDINEQQQQQQQQNSRGYFLDPSTLPPLISSPYGKFPSTQPDNYWHSSEKRRRINSPHHPPPPLLTTPRPGNTPVVGISATTPISQSMTMSTQAPGTGFRSQNGNKNFDAMSFDFKSPMSANRALHGQSPSTFHQSPNLEAPGNDLIQNLTRIIQASDSGEGIQLSSTTLEELRNTLQQAQSRPFKGNP